MARFKDNHGFTIKGWMSSRLGLKGTERIVYAIIYGFTFNPENEFYAGHQYLAEAATTSVDTVKRALVSLQEKGLIWKADRVNDGVSRCRYSVYVDEKGDGIFCPNEEGAKCTGGRVQNAQGGGCKMPPPINNINNNIKRKENNNKKETVEDLFKEENPEYLFNQWFIENFPTLAKNKRPLKYKTYIMLQSKYPKEKIILKLNAMESMMNFNKKYSDVGRTLWNWLAKDYDDNTKGRTINKK
jgi:predicted transcriptional regulator